MSTTLFEERQRFRQDWLWALMLISTVPAYGLIVVVLVDDAGGFGPDLYPHLPARHS